MLVREPLHVGHCAGAWEDRVDLAVCSCHLFQRDHSLIRCSPRVPQAPTTQGVEPDFFFWRASGARRCSRAGRLPEGKKARAAKLVLAVYFVPDRLPGFDWPL